ncbi:MAG: serine hydrolase [Methanobacterium sp.]
MKKKTILYICLMLCLCLALLFWQYAADILYKQKNAARHDPAGKNKAVVAVQNTAENKSVRQAQALKEHKGQVDAEKLQAGIEKYLQEKANGSYKIGFRDLSANQEFMIGSGSVPSASIIKIYIMIEVFNQAKQGLLNLEDKIALKQENMVGGTGSLNGQPVGSKISITELLEVMITRSDNTAANTLIDLAGMDKINQTARQLGCRDTRLQRKMMDFASIKAGKDNLTSVSDLLLILDKLYKGKCVNHEFDEQMINIMKRQQYNQMIPKLLPAGTVVAHKTGSLSGINNDIAIVFTKHGDYILCILNQQTNNTKQAEDCIAAISKMIFNAYTAEK